MRKVSFLAKMAVIALFCGVMTVNASDDIDQVITEIETFVDTYLADLKLVMTGDQAAIMRLASHQTEYQQRMAKIEATVQQAEAAGVEPTEEQRQRIINIVEKVRQELLGGQ